jgi:hypothetical protein
MKKTIWTFGLIAGGILSAIMLVTVLFQDRLGFDRGEVIGYATMVAAFLLTFFGIRSYRDNVRNGRVSFGRALSVGLLITLVASVCYAATWQVVYFGLETDFVAKYEAYEITKARQHGATQAEIDKRQAENRRFAELYDNPLINFAMTILEPLPVGLVLSLISAGVLSRALPTAADGTDRRTLLSRARGPASLS